MNRNKFSYGLWMFAGVYLIYLAYSVLKSVINGDEKNPVVFVIFSIFFIICAFFLIFTGGRNLYRLTKKEKEDMINNIHEQSEQKDADQAEIKADEESELKTGMQADIKPETDEQTKDN